MASTKSFACIGFLLFAAFASASNVQTKVTPIEKVISLLKDLSVKVEEEGKKEAAQYDKYSCFCKEQADQKLYQIETSREKISELTATIEKLTADIDALATDISALAEKITGLEAEIEAAVTQRNEEHAAYVVNATDCDNAISAIERAIEALKESKGAIKGTQYYDAKTDFAQVSAAATRVLNAHPDSWVQTELGKLNQPAGRSAGYEYQSNDIIATLEGLKDQFLKIKKDMDFAEFKTQDAFEKKKLGLENEKKFAEQDKAQKEAISEEKTNNKEAAEADKTQETNDMNADQNFLNVVTEDCEKAAGLFDQRSKTRAAELTALSEATKVLEEKALGTYSYNKKLVALQKNTPTLSSKAQVSRHSPSFLQLQGRNSQKTSAEAQEFAARKAFQFLKAAAIRLNSPELSAAVLKVQVSADHFVKVRGLIKDLIGRLEADAASEATQKSFCDQGMAQALAKRDNANAGVEDAKAQIKGLNAEKDQLTLDLAKLAKDIADTKKALLEATELRAEEKADNEKTIAMATQGKEAVEYAMQVLNEFYQGAAGSSLLQYVPPNSDREGNTVGDLAPEIFDSEYKGAQSESGGIIGILEVIRSDFERTIGVVTEEEQFAQEDFEMFQKDAQEEIEAREQDVKDKNARMAEVEDELVEQENTLKNNQELLESATKELDTLKVMCVQGEETYAERVAARKKEIEALKEAQAILESWQA